MIDIDFVKAAVPMKNAVEHYGFQVCHNVIFCPFHSEHTASCHIYEKSFFCFGCNTGGDVIRFVQLLFNEPFLAAIARLSNDFGLGLNCKNMKLDRAKHIAVCEKRERERRELEAYRTLYDSLSDIFHNLWDKQRSLPLTVEEKTRLDNLERWLCEHAWR